MNIRLPEERVRKLPIDMVVALRDLDYALLGRLQELEPTGTENPAPVLAAGDLLVHGVRRVGKEGAHLKLRLSQGTMTFEAIGFGLGPLAAELPMRVDVAFHLEDNEWNGRHQLQLRIRDLKPVGKGIPKQ